MTIPTEPYDSLDQFWAGGSGSTNEIWAGLSLENNKLGTGEFTVKIVDMDRKFNINAADEAVLQQAMSLMGMDVADSAGISEAILDWRAPDDEPR